MPTDPISYTRATPSRSTLPTPRAEPGKKPAPKTESVETKPAPKASAPAPKGKEPPKVENPPPQIEALPAQAAQAKAPPEPEAPPPVEDEKVLAERARRRNVANLYAKNQQRANQADAYE